MAKFASTLILVGCIITVQALPPAYDEILAAAQNRQWEQAQQLLSNNFAKNGENKPIVFDGVRNLKPLDGGHVYGEAEYSFHSASNIGGKTTEDKAGHKVVNVDGKVKEFDFTPKTELSPLIHSINPQSQIADYSLQYDPSSVGQSADYVGIGGKKVSNNNIKIGQPTNLPAIPHSFPGIPSQGAQGGQNSYNHQYSYTHSHSYVNGKPVVGGLVKNGGNFQLDAQKAISPLSYTDVRDLKPSPGGQVFGEAQYQFHTTSNVNGKVSEDKGGHKIINNNGQVQEFDFPNGKPIEGGLVNTGSNFQLGPQKSIVSPLSYTDVRDLKPSPGGQVFGEAQYQFHTTSNVNGKVSEDKGGHKIINNNGQVQEFDFPNGKPIEGGLVNTGGNFQLGAHKPIVSPVSYTDVRDLKPSPGGQVFGQAQYQSHTTSNVGGKVSENQGGHKIINNNGQVQEFDFTPKPKKSPVVTYFN